MSDIDDLQRIIKRLESLSKEIKDLGKQIDQFRRGLPQTDEYERQPKRKRTRDDQEE